MKLSSRKIYAAKTIFLGLPLMGGVASCLGALLILLVQGCALAPASTEFSGAVPAVHNIQPDTGRAWPVSRSGLPIIKIAVVSMNVRQRGSVIALVTPAGPAVLSERSDSYPPLKGPFRVKLELHAYTDGFELDPHRIVLRRVIGQITAQRVIGPLMAWEQLRVRGVEAMQGLQWPCGWESSASEPPTERVIVPRGDSCLVFVFDVEPPLPTEEFWIDIDGLAFEGRPVPVPATRFKHVELTAH